MFLVDYVCFRIIQVTRKCLESVNRFCQMPISSMDSKFYNMIANKCWIWYVFQFFLELMKVPRIESKLRVFAFKITFSSQVYCLRICLFFYRWQGFACLYCWLLWVLIALLLFRSMIWEIIWIQLMVLLERYHWN